MSNPTRKPTGFYVRCGVKMRQTIVKLAAESEKSASEYIRGILEKEIERLKEIKQ